METLRSQIRAFLRLGEPEQPSAFAVHAQAQEDGYTRKAISYRVADGDTIEALLFEPDARRRDVAVLALHQHNSEWALGKSEIAGLAGDPLQAFGPALARAGITVLAPDALGFESRRGVPGSGGALAPTLTKPLGTASDWLQYYNHAMHRLVRGELLMTKVLSDIAAAASVLVQQTGAPRLGMVGHSHGGNLALFAAAVDTRIAFACASGAACSYRYKLSHGIGLENALVIPGFATRFDFDDLMRCIAPRQLFVVSSEGDPYSADASELVLAAAPTFEAAGAPANLRHLRHGASHALDAQRFAAIVDWTVAQTA